MFNVDDKYDLPRDVVHKDSLIEIIGRNEFVVENYTFGSPTAVLTASYVTDSGTEGTLTLTLGTKNVDGDSYYARMDDDTTIYPAMVSSMGVRGLAAPVRRMAE